MKFKKVCLIIVALIISISCYAEDNEEMIWQVEGLTVYSLENIKNSNLQNNEWDLSLNNLSMDEFNGFGFRMTFEPNNSILLSMGSDLLYYENNSDFYFEYRSLTNFFYSIGKKITIENLLFFQVDLSINTLGFALELDDFDAYYKVTSPSIDLKYGLDFNIFSNFNIFYEIQNHIWFTDPYMGAVEYDEWSNGYYSEPIDIKVSDVYEKSQHSLGVQIKF
jgi:hypothetical protein